MRADEILVTGATGFIGGHLVDRLRKERYPLRFLIRQPDLIPERLDCEGVSIIPGDITDPDVVDRAVRGAAAVIHLATGKVETRDVAADHPQVAAKLRGLQKTARVDSPLFSLFK